MKVRIKKFLYYKLSRPVFVYPTFLSDHSIMEKNGHWKMIKFSCTHGQMDGRTDGNLIFRVGFSRIPTILGQRPGEEAHMVTGMCIV